MDQPLGGEKVLDLLHVLSGESDLGRRYNYGNHLIIQVVLLQFRLVAQSCQTLCNPMDCSMPGSPVHHQLPELTQTHVHRVGDAIQPSHPLLSPSSPAFSLSQH